MKKKEKSLGLVQLSASAVTNGLPGGALLEGIYAVYNRAGN